MAKKASTRKSTVSESKVGAAAKKRLAGKPALATTKRVLSAASRPAIAAPILPRKLKSPLTKAELAEFRQMLVEKRRAILGDMNGIEAEALRQNRQDGAGDLSNMPTHPADIGTDNFEQEFTLGLLESERTMLKEINEALERIDNGTYGVCVGTGQPIPLARLRARPWSRYCVEYARLLEKGLVRPHEERHEGDEAEGRHDEEEDDTVEEDSESHPAGDDEIERVEDDEE